MIAFFFKENYSKIEGCFVYDKGVYDNAFEAFITKGIYAVDSNIEKATRITTAINTLSIINETLAAVGASSHLAVYVINGREFQCHDLNRREYWESSGALIEP